MPDEKKTILLVEDEAILALAQKEILVQAGYEVMLAHDGESAVAGVEEAGRIDLVLMDIDLGRGIDGTRAAEIILQNHDIPVVFLSSHTEPETVNRTEKITSYGYIDKNSGETVLLNSLKMAFRLFSAHSDIRRQKTEIEAANKELAATVEELQATNEQFEAANEALIRSQNEILASRAELSEREAWFRALYEKSPVSIELYGPDGFLTDANRACLAIFGVSDVTHIRGFNLFENPNFPEDQQTIVRSGKTARYETLYDFDLVRHLNLYPTSRSGKIYIDVQITPLMDKKNATAGYMVQIQEITSRKQAEAELVFKNTVLSTQIETSLDGILIVNEQGTIIAFNRTFLDIWKIPEEVAATGSDELTLSAVHDKLLDPDAFFARVYYLYEHTNESSSEEILLKDGRVLDRYSAPMRGADGIFYGRIWYFRDITVRKRLNEEIRNSQRNLKYIIDFFPDAIMGIDRDKRVTIWNRAIEKMTGIPADEMIGKGDYAYTVPFYGIQRPQLMDLFWVPDHEIAAKYPGLEKEGDNLVTEVFCPSLYGGKGALIWAKAAPLLDNEGRLAGAIESLRDITAQRNAEDLLHKSEERFRRLTENAHDIIYRMSLPDGTYEYVSPAVFEITGYTPEEFYDDPSLIRNIIHPASRPYFALQWENLQRGEVPPVYEFRIINRSGQEKWVYQRNVLVLDDQGNPAAIEGIVTDITAIKKIEHELSDAKIMLEAAFEQTPIPMVLVSMPDAVIRVVNTATRKFLGIDNEPSSKNKPLSSLLPSWKDFDSAGNQHPIDHMPLGRAMRGENVVGEEYYLITRNGEKKWETVNAAPIYNSSGDMIAVCIAFLDITEHKRLLEEKDILLKELQHRVKNSMSVISSMVGLEINRARDANTHGILQSIRDRIQSISGIYEMLYLSEELREIQLDQYLDRLIASLLTSHSERRERIRTLIHLDKIRIDVRRAIPIGLIANELITNSLKHAFPGERCGTISVSLRQDGDGGAALEISDDGVGFQDKTSDEGDSGLGLTLVRMLTTQIGGTFLRKNGTHTAMVLTVPGVIRPA